MYNTVISQSQKFRFKIYSSNISLILFIILPVLFITNVMAQGNLLISPHRVIFEGQKRVMDVNLANTGQDSAKYSISFLQYRMTENGDFETITTPDPGQNFADKNIRFFPRSIMLGPNESQVVKLLLTKSEQLQPGEYISHLYFRALPNQKALGEENVKNDTASISIKITPIFGITIPVIIRVGTSTTTVNITDLKLGTKDSTKQLFFTIHRTGNMSVIGDISISHIAPNGRETKIGLSKNIAIYASIPLRRLKIDVENKASVDMSKGTIRVLFSTQSETRPMKLAEAELLL